MDLAIGANDELAVHAAAVARLLKLVANERRLLVLCRLASAAEATVGELAKSVGLSQSALSQHLALMREDGLVAFRRDGQTIHYRIADPNAERLLETLRTIFCPT
jgi:ArsR family transcriptional regulator, virulence genes transcriptional regulator